MQKIKGNFFIILSAVIFGFMPIMGSITYQEGSNAVMLTFLRTACTVPVLFVILKIMRISLKISRQQIKELLLLSLAGSGLTTVLLYESYNFVPVGTATSLHFVYPLFVAIGAVLIFKEKLTRPTIIALVIALAGIALFLGEKGGSIAGIALALISGGTYAFYILYLEHSSLLVLHPFKLTFYINLFVACMVFVYGAIIGNLTLAITPKGWLLSILLSLLCGLVAITCFQVGVKLSGSISAAILSMFEPITSVIFGILLLGEAADAKRIVGCVLILAGVTILTLFKEEKKTSN